MSVLSKEEIERRLKLPLHDLESLVITPLLNDEFDHDAVDLSLGCYFRLPNVSSTACVGPNVSNGRDHYPGLIHKLYRPYVPVPDKLKKETEKSSQDQSKSENNNSSLILQPHHAVLACTLEYIKMPEDVSGQILTKSSWARLFISIASAPWIHPFYRGCLTLEITNLGNVPVNLPIGEPIAQLIFMEVIGQEAKTKDIIEGSYAGAIMPEAPKFG
jgi:deoxycytidine triphosphate deaminase